MEKNKSEKLLTKPVLPLITEFWLSSLIPLVLYSLFTLTDAFSVSRWEGAEAMSER